MHVMCMYMPIHVPFLTCLHFSGGVWASRGCAGDQDEKRGDCRERQVRDGGRGRDEERE